MVLIDDINKLKPEVLTIVYFGARQINTGDETEIKEMFLVASFSWLLSNIVFVILRYGNKRAGTVYQFEYLWILTIKKYGDRKIF